MRDESLAFLRHLLTTPSPTGFELAGQRIWWDYVAPFADSVTSDAYGNVIATINPGGSPTILLGGHADEIGFMVNHINEDGFIYYRPIGGVDPSLVRGHRVTIHNENGPVAGVTAAPPIHLKEKDNEKAPKHHEIFIDIGATSREEAETLVQIGDPITFADDFQLLRDDVAVARAFDNRVGTFAVAEALRLVAAQRDTLQARVVALSSVMEEIGGFGARMVAYEVKPDVALVTDVTHATDVPGISASRHGGVKLGKGPVLAHSAAVHPVVRRRLVEVAKASEIPLQFETSPNRTATDLDDIFVTRGGVPSALISIPNRYMHTTVEMIRLGDLVQVGQLMAAFALDVRAGERFWLKVRD